MAKTSKIVKNHRRREMVARYAERRTELEAAVRTAPNADERAAAQVALQRLPRDAGPTRLRNRDVDDGRPRGHLRTSGLSRVRFRQMAHDGGTARHPEGRDVSGRHPRAGPVGPPCSF